MDERKELHVVLGASGTIGMGVLSELEALRIPCVGVARTAQAGWVQADLTDEKQTLSACKGATHIYLCAGLTYSTAVWRRDWPRIVDNVIAAAASNSSKIIFIDNIYMYGPPPLLTPITETHPTEPTSKKGKIRKEIAEKLLRVHADGVVETVIARAPDFYGPGATTSLLYLAMLKNMLEGKTAQWIGNQDLIHTFAYTTDVSRAMVLLARDPEAFGTVWHMPTRPERVTVRSIHATFAEELGIRSKLITIPRGVVSLLGVVMPIMRELGEMNYQYFNDYVFSSDKFSVRYPSFAVTAYDEGLKQMVVSFRPKA